MKLFDRLKSKLGRGEAVEAEVAREVASGEMPQLVLANRAYRRAITNAHKCRGAGWTRPYRKGRTQRHSESTTTNH